MEAHSWVSVMQAMMTPLIGLLAAYIAWQQWRTNRRKLALEMYERRLDIYRRLRDMLSKAADGRDLNFEDIHRFYMDTAEADFLFDEDVRAYVDEVYERAIRLQSAQSEYRSYEQPPLPGVDPVDVEQRMNREIRWFVNQHAPSLSLFQRYLRLRT